MKLFGVTSRTIRDIWNRQSWSFATRPLWNREPDFIATMAGRRAGISTMKVSRFLELFHSWPRLDQYIEQDDRDKQLKAGRPKGSRDKRQRLRRLKHYEQLQPILNAITRKNQVRQHPSCSQQVTASQLHQQLKINRSGNSWERKHSIFWIRGRESRTFRRSRIRFGPTERTGEML
jgi:hypothetical protein